MHVIILLAGIFSHVPATPNVPTLDHPPTIVYGGKGSIIGKHQGYGYRLNQNPEGVAITIIQK